jgi:hypothetical protein
MFTLKSYQRTLKIDGVPEDSVPVIVAHMGSLVAALPDHRVQAYQELSSHTAALLTFYGADHISDDAKASVSSKLYKTVDPLVSLHSRVDRLFRAHQQDEPEHVREEAEKLWAALEYHAQTLTGKTFEDALKEES